MMTEELICRELLKMMETCSFEQVKISQLAERCGISRTSFYNYFDSVYDVLQKIEDDFMNDLLGCGTARVENDPSELMEAFAHLRDSIDTFSILTGPNGDPSFRARLENKNRRTSLALASELKSNITDVELQVINEFALAGKIRVFQWWAEHKNYVSVNDMMGVMKKLNAAMIGAMR